MCEEREREKEPYIYVSIKWKWAHEGIFEEKPRAASVSVTMAIDA